MYKILMCNITFQFCHQVYSNKFGMSSIVMAQADIDRCGSKNIVLLLLVIGYCIILELCDLFESLSPPSIIHLILSDLSKQSETRILPMCGI